MLLREVIRCGCSRIESFFPLHLGRVLGFVSGVRVGWDAVHLALQPCAELPPSTALEIRETFGCCGGTPRAGGKAGTPVGV